MGLHPSSSISFINDFWSRKLNRENYLVAIPIFRVNQGGVMSNRPLNEDRQTFNSNENQSFCPHCLELLSVDSAHICPVACCYIGVGERSFMVICPYCSDSFRRSDGHVCLVLIRLTEPAQ